MYDLPIWFGLLVLLFEKLTGVDVCNCCAWVVRRRRGLLVPPANINKHHYIQILCFDEKTWASTCGTRFWGQSQSPDGQYSCHSSLKQIFWSADFCAISDKSTGLWMIPYFFLLDQLSWRLLLFRTKALSVYLVD